MSSVLVALGSGLAGAASGDPCGGNCRVWDEVMDCAMPPGPRWAVRVLSKDDPAPSGCASDVCVVAEADSGERVWCDSGEDRVRTVIVNVGTLDERSRGLSVAVADRVVFEDPPIAPLGRAGILGVELGSSEVALDDVNWVAPSASIALGTGLLADSGSWTGGGVAEDLAVDAEQDVFVGLGSGPIRAARLPAPRAERCLDAAAPEPSRERVSDGLAPLWGVLQDCFPEGTVGAFGLLAEIQVGCDGLAQEVRTTGRALPEPVVSCVERTLRAGSYGAHGDPDGATIRVPLSFAFARPRLGD